MAQCMLKVLKATPGVVGARLEVTNRIIWSGGDDWVHPYLEYSSLAENGERHTILFESEKFRRADRDAYVFVTVIPTGLMPAGSKQLPSDWGTTAITQKWKAQCGADASVVTA
jgi:hypothetical protein